MKTMLELLIRLHEMRCCCERVLRNPQLTQREKDLARHHKQLVRECLPVAVLTHYDQMKKTERTLRTCPEIFGMGVLVATYRSLSPLQRRRLVRHFNTPSKHQTGWHAARSLPGSRSRSRRGSLTQSRSRNRALQS